MAARAGRLIHLVGSVPLDSAEAVFRLASGALGPALKRLPDGETGKRGTWIGWQREWFSAQAALEPAPAREREYQMYPPLRLRAGHSVDEVKFVALGYADFAGESYVVFRRLKERGEIPPSMRFLIALPTAYAPVYAHTAYELQPAIYPKYEARLLDELAAICAAIPHDQLAVQWDVATEMSNFEGVYPCVLPGGNEFLRARLAYLGEQVPARVELGYHLCYGSMGGKHWMDPKDAGLMTDIANDIARRLTRKLQFLHMPVPRDRSDAAFFAPLANLRLRPETEFYLGLVHDEDGIDGTRARARAAAEYFPGFGVAAECGFGRRNPASIPALLRLHAEAAQG